jgi:hypothetical protein
MVSECRQVATRLAARGLAECCSSQDIARALVPLPDVPYLSCVAQLPRPGAYLVEASPAKEVKGKAAKAKAKGKGDKDGKGAKDGKKKKKKAK